MKLVKTILIFPFYVCCLDKYYSSESLCKDCFCCCEDENETIIEDERINEKINKNVEEIEEANKIELNENENLGVNLNNNEILAIKKYIYFKLSKDEQYSINSIDNCEESTHKCKKITLNNSKNEEFILFIKGDKDPTFVFESLKVIGMSKIDYVYYNGYLVTSKVDGDVYENGNNFDFKKIKNLNVYRFFCSLLGCSDCEPFYRIDNVYIKNDEVFLLDYLPNGFSKIKSIEKFLDKLTYNTQEIPSEIVFCNNNYLKKYKEEEEQAFWVSSEMISCGAYCEKEGYFATNLNNNISIACNTCLLKYLKDYCSLKLRIEYEKIFGYLKANMFNNNFINGFKKYCKKKKEQNTDDDIEGLLEKLNKKNLEDFFNEELEWGRRIIKHTKTKMEEYTQKINKLKESYKISDQEKEKVGEKLNRLIEFYQSKDGKKLIEKYQNNFKIVVSYLNDLINMSDFIGFMEDSAIVRAFVHNNSTYIIE